MLCPPALMALRYFYEERPELLGGKGGVMATKKILIVDDDVGVGEIVGKLTAVGVNLEKPAVARLH